MTRIVAGAARGRVLAVPVGEGTRPTSDRVREALFSSLTSLLSPVSGAAFTGVRVLDLYAGTGAFGLEALSRGAAHALLVERDARVVRVLRANVDAVGLPGAEVRPAAVERLLAEPAADPFDLAFLDPPYRLAVDGTLRALATGGWLREGGLCVVERSRRDAPLTWPDGFEPISSKPYGQTVLWYGRSSCAGLCVPVPSTR